MKNQWLHSRFESLVDIIGHLYNRHADDDEETAKKIDEYLSKNILWQDFKKTIRRNDELWLFRSEPSTWNQGKGKEGYCIVRDGEIIKYFLSVGTEE